MTMTSLQGIFDSYRPKSKKNFIQENVRQLRIMRKAWVNNMNNKEKNDGLPKKSNKFGHIPAKVPAHITTRSTSRPMGESPEMFEDANNKDAPSRRSILSSLSAVRSGNIENAKLNQLSGPKPVLVRKSRVFPTSLNAQLLNNGHDSGASDKEVFHKNSLTKSLSALPLPRSPLEPLNMDEESIHRAASENPLSVQPIRNVGSQTVSPEDSDSMFDGVIKYPSSCVIETVRTESSHRSFNLPTCDSGQQTDLPLNLVPSHSVPSMPPTPSVLSRVSRASVNRRNPIPTDNILWYETDQQSHPIEEGLVRRFKNTSINGWKDQIDNKKNQIGNKKNQITDSVISGYKNKKLIGKVQNQKCIDTVPQPLQSHETSEFYCPSIHTMCSESERLEALKNLQKCYDDNIRQLNSLPVKTDTLKMRLRKIEIEKRLTKLEENIKIYSREKFL